MHDTVMGTLSESSRQTGGMFEKLRGWLHPVFEKAMAGGENSSANPE